MKEKRWKPKNGEMYWYVWNDGNACWGNFTGTSDKRRFKSGNCFKTEAEAEAAAEKVKALLLSLHSEPVTDCNQSAQPTTNSSQLLKLTAEVFDRPDCPAEATFAIVYPDGSASYMKGDPAKMKSSEMYWIYSVSSGIDQLSEIPGKFDASNWRCSLIERPAKLPDWCKDGEWGFDTTVNIYIKISKDDIIKYSAKICKYISDGEIVQARLRPYNAEEMKGLVGKIICEANASHVATTCIHHDGTDYLRLGIHLYEAEELISKGFTIDGKPCAILEHLENGEWVK